MKKKKKLKLNKYTIRRFLAIFIIIMIIVLIKVLMENKEKIPDLSILLNNEFLNTKKEVIIDEQENIYFSKEDIQAIFDEMIYYNAAEKELITTHNKHIAVLKQDESIMVVNDNNINISGKMQEINNIVYLPIKDLKTVYDIEIQYLKENNRIIIDSLLNEKKQATLEDNVKLKKQKGLFKRTITKLQMGENVIVIEKDKKYAKIRNASGEIGYIKSDKLINELVIREKKETEKYDLKVYDEYSNISGIYQNITVEKEKLNVVIPTFFYVGKNTKILDKTASSNLCKL